MSLKIFFKKTSTGGTPLMSHVNTGDIVFSSDLLISVWEYLISDLSSLLNAELVCREWRKLMKNIFWEVACKQSNVSKEQLGRYNSAKAAMMSVVFHYHWKNSFWGDTPSTTVKGTQQGTDYLLYDSFPNFGFLYKDTLVVYTISPICDGHAKRTLFLTGCIPQKGLSGLAETSHEADSCFFLAKFKASAPAIKTDMYLDQAVIMTEKCIEVFKAGTSTTSPSEELSCIGKLDCSGIPCSNIAVIHICDSSVYALTKEPPGIQVWSTETFQKTRKISLPGVFWWPADDAYATWKSQEKFSFKDTKFYGVVIDDGGSVWAVNIQTGSVCRIPVEDPRRKAMFETEVSIVPFCTPTSVPYPNPSVRGEGLPLVEGSIDQSDPSLCQTDQMDISPLELVPANVRVCGPCILLWGGKDNVNSEKSESRGRAFIQLWRSETSYNSNSESSDLRCVLHAKYDHLLMAHTDAKRVSVLFHPFFEDSTSGTHIPHLAVDIWDANGNGFICRRIVHDEDRSLMSFINTTDLSPCVIQIVGSGPEELLYYISQVIDEENVLALRQFTTLAGVKESTEVKNNIPKLHAIWFDLNPEHQSTVEPRTRRVSIAVACPEEKQLVWLWTCDGDNDTSDYKILFKARCDSSERSRTSDPFYIDFIQATAGNLLFRSKPDPLLYPMPDWSTDPTAINLIAHLFGSSSNHILQQCPYRGDHAGYKQHGQPSVPIVSTQLKTYNDKKGTALQAAAATLYHNLGNLDSILIGIAKKHHGVWYFVPGSNYPFLY